nr:hypothetical protein [Tanacetum cinerariifolium]
VNTVRSKNVNTARPKAVVNVVKGNIVNTVKASACWVWKSKIKVIDHVSKHNSASITLKKLIMLMHKADPNYEEIDREYVAFGGNPKGGKITGKGAIRTGTQSNGFAGIKACDNAGQARKEKEPIKDYILLPLCTTDPPFSQDPKSS